MGGHEGYLTIGLYEDGTPGEIFLRMAKEGSTISGLMDVRHRGQPGAAVRRPAARPGDEVQPPALRAGRVHDQPGDPMAKSLVDYIFRYMATKFLDRDEQDQVGIINRQLKLSEADVAGGELAATDYP